MKFSHLALLMLTLGARGAMATPLLDGCDDILSIFNQNLSPTESLWVYVENLLQNKLINPKDFLLFYTHLKNGELINPVEHTVSAYGPVFQTAQHHLHYYQFQNHLTQFQRNPGTVDIEQLKIKVENELIKRKWEQKVRAVAKQETKALFSKISTVLVKPSTFMMGYDDEIQVTISKPFEMASTHITQYQWAKITDQAPFYHPNNQEKTKLLNSKGETLYILPEYPANNISWEEVQFFINKINELSKNGDPLLNELFENHHPGDVYAIPTEAQYCLAMKRAKTKDGDSIDQMIARTDFEGIKQYAWFSENAQNSPHPVAELSPLYIDGKAIYDLQGNVSSWTSDAYHEIEVNMVDPHYDYYDTVNLHVTKGASFDMVPRLMSSSMQFSQLRDSRNSKRVGLGLRIIKLVPSL